MNASLLKKSLLIGTTCGALSTAFCAPQNFIVILADDQGYNDLGCFGSERIKSPNLDQMAREGMRFTNFYSASSVCSPSRASLLTGRIPKRAGVPRVLSPFRGEQGLPPSEITIAEFLKEKDYKTALIGKWHLGHAKHLLPLTQGFDSFFGFPYSNDMTIAKELSISPNIKFNNGYTHEKLQEDLKKYLKNYQKMKGTMPLMRGNEVVEYPVDQTTITQRYTEEAQKFIRESKDEPFFLYFAHAMPHRPLFASKKFQGTGPEKYSDAVHEIDWSVGEVLKTLKETGLDKNTLVIYTSDNGPAGNGGEAGLADPFRGKKFMTFEGGVRVPTIVWSPSFVPKNVVCNEMVSNIDIFPTIAGFINADLPKNRVYDGFDVGDLLTGKTQKSPRNVNYYYEANLPDIDGIRVGDWKFLEKGDRDMAQFKKNVKPRVFKPMLFNLKNDPSESENLISKNPEKAASLKKQMEKFDATVDTPADSTF